MITEQTLAEKDQEATFNSLALREDRDFYNELVPTLEAYAACLRAELEKKEAKKDSSYYRIKMDLLEVEHGLFYKKITQKKYLERVAEDEAHEAAMLALRSDPKNWDNLEYRLLKLQDRYKKREDHFVRISNILNLYRTKKKNGTLKTERNLFDLMNNELSKLESL